MGKIAFVFSGQGDQFPGMGKNLYEKYPAARKIYDLCDGIRPGTSARCFDGTEEELKETGNTQPCLFATELARPHRGNQVLERFRNYDVSPEALARLKDAAGNAEKLKDAQLHALALINSVYPFPNVYPVNQIPLPELNEAEKAMPAERRLAQSRIVALGSVASMNKRAVSQNVNACKDILRANVGAAAAEVGKKIVILRTVLLGLAGLVMLILIGTFVALYKQMIHPLQGFVQLITANQPLDEEKGLQEVRLVASAYNSLRKRRDALDAILRSAAETDALTNLPNRYRFEQYLLDVGERGYSLAILMFDINYLKETNDTEGHSAGDNLIRTAAQCITSCFGEKSFRIGGDEFAAVVLDEADKQMYAEKQAAHKRLRQYV